MYVKFSFHKHSTLFHPPKVNIFSIEKIKYRYKKPIHYIIFFPYIVIKICTNKSLFML